MREKSMTSYTVYEKNPYWKQEHLYLHTFADGDVKHIHRAYQGVIVRAVE